MPTLLRGGRSLPEGSPLRALPPRPPGRPCQMPSLRPTPGSPPSLWDPNCPSLLAPLTGGLFSARGRSPRHVCLCCWAPGVTPAAWDQLRRAGPPPGLRVPRGPVHVHITEVPKHRNGKASSQTVHFRVAESPRQTDRQTVLSSGKARSCVCMCLLGAGEPLSPLCNTECEEPKRNTSGCRLVSQLGPRQAKSPKLRKGRASLPARSHACGFSLLARTPRTQP